MVHSNSDADNGCLTLSNKKLISKSNEYSSVRFNTSYYSPAGVSTTDKLAKCKIPVFLIQAAN